MPMLHNPYKVVRMFEEEIANYTGAPYAISIDSCTNALFLICKYNEVKEVTIPSKTYLSVPQSIIHATYIKDFKAQLHMVLKQQILFACND